MSARGRTRPESRRAWIARPRWRISLGSTIAMGPGKADLLEAIGRAGSISAGARSIGMSYRRAWLLVETMNACFVRPLVVTSKWRGGGARLTPAGKDVLRLYREVEARSRAASRALVADIRRLLGPPSGRRLPFKKGS
ncbi:MAG TPA: LysR family transcriptional regulator [Candidatus Polarisedimenticolia bacterium]|jgi:molybdate transport system regulatory protein|nr:LysR family transcriptional regulator [Candidatus Polarisedimenticolia bacterium]